MRINNRVDCVDQLGDVFYVWFLHYVSSYSVLDHDIIKYMMIFFPHYFGFLLYFLYVGLGPVLCPPPLSISLRMHTSSILLVPCI